MKHHRRGHHRGATFAGITLAAAASIAIVSVLLLAGGQDGSAVRMHRLAKPGVTPPRLTPIVAAAQRITPIVLRDEPVDVPALPRAAQEGEAGREILTRSTPVPTSADAHSYMTENAVALQHSFDRQSLIERISRYMGAVPAAYLIPLMVDEGYEHGVDPRLCAVTCIEESSGHGNLFGALGCSIGSCDYETQVRWYYDQVIRNGYTDTWTAAWYWHGGGSQGEEHSFYADNVARQVMGI